MSASQIVQFYAGKKILVTGATGFMGKVLVEKLLRECDDISEIYILVRAKKGLSPDQRHADYVKNIIFERIYTGNPNQLNKIKVIKGDVQVDGLDINENDVEQLINNVNIVIHCAATVRFDENIRDSVELNTIGTYRALQLAEKMKNLQVFTHISTAYCQVKEDILEEKYYPSKQDPYDVMDIIRKFSDEELQRVTPELLRGLPNTYTLTKSMGEELVHRFRKKFPAVICRPSIVTAALSEPFPGYVDGYNGATGLMIGAGKGVIRSLHCNPDFNNGFVPVDIVVNGIIASTYKRTNMQTDDVLYINIADSEINAITWGESIDIGLPLYHEYPLSNLVLWAPNGSIKKYFWYHQLCIFLFQFLPAYIIDFFLFCFRRKTFMVKVQKRIIQGITGFHYYTTRNWVFKNSNLIMLYEEMNVVDKKMFRIDFMQINWKIYIMNYLLGIRTYILKEKPEKLPEARTNIKRMLLIGKFFSILFYGLVFYYLKKIITHAAANL